MSLRPALLTIGLASLAACATTPKAPAGPANYDPIVGEAAPPQARLIADCLAASISGRAYRRASDADTEMIVFTCEGAPARAFYQGLAARSAAVESEVTVDDRTLRSTERVNRDLFGVDWCERDAAGDYRCDISLNVGDFLAE